MVDHDPRSPTRTRTRWFEPSRSDWQVAALFIIGSSCFALGALPPYANAVGPAADGVTYFIGSIFFTSAALLQVLISAGVIRADERPRSSVRWRGRVRSPDRPEWWAGVVQFIGIADHGPGFAAHFVDGSRIECADFAGLHSERPPHLNGSSPAFLQRRIIEICIRVRVQNFVRERRWLRRIHRNGAHAAASDRIQQMLQSIQVHRFMETIPNRFIDERVIRQANISHDIFAACRLVRKNGREQIVRPHALNRRRSFAAAGKPQHGQSARCIPSPAGGKHGSGKQRLRENSLDAVGVQELEDRIERKTMLFAK